MRSVWALFLLLVGGSLAANYIKLAAIWGQKIWGKDRKHHGPIHFSPLVNTCSFSSQPQMELEVSGHTTFKTYCLRDRCGCENLCFQESFYILTLTCLSNCKYICVSLHMWQWREHSISQGLCLLFIQFFQGYVSVTFSRAQLVYLFATCIHIFSSLHFLAPVNKNMSLTSEPSFEKQLLCA